MCDEMKTYDSEMEEEWFEEEPYLLDECGEGCCQVTRKSSAGATTSLVLGIISSIAWIIPVIGLPITIVGIVLGAINMKNVRHKGIAIAGFVINIIFLAVTIAKGIVDIVKYFKQK